MENAVEDTDYAVLLRLDGKKGGGERMPLTDSLEDSHDRQTCSRDLITGWGHLNAPTPFFPPPAAIMMDCTVSSRVESAVQDGICNEN